MSRGYDANDASSEAGALADELLALYTRAVNMHRLDVAEHLLCALETLAASGAACEAALQQAYSEIVRLHQSDH